MKVIIDSVPPSLILEPDGRRGGVARVRWEVKDENLDLKSLTLEYQIVGVREWRRVPLRRPALLGSESWDANTIEAIRVRASVADKAGNIAENEIVLPEGAAAAPDLASVDPEGAFAPPIEQIPQGNRSPITESPAFPPVEDDLSTAPRPGTRRQVARAGTNAVVGSSPPTPDWDRASNGGGTSGGAAMPAASNNVSASGCSARVRRSVSQSGRRSLGGSRSGGSSP